ncbi:ChaN family lipoprotein [Shimia sp.]|uniref:ChaN family lipoprotein n=1 Tax=Shimia sp. TaxID=1954381 RepID=UPI003565F6C8
MRPLIPALALMAAPALAFEITASDIALLPQAEVILIGELHDNPWHHENQAQAVAALEPAALVFEMLSPEQALRVTPQLVDDEAALEETLGWAESGWPDFAMYYPVFRAGQGADVYGAQVPRAALGAVVMQGSVTADFAPLAARYGLGEPLDPAEQSAREDSQLQAHCNALPPAMLPGMVLAQRLRDAALAGAVEEALERSGAPVVVITGNGHARRDWGVPRLLADRAGVVAIAQFEAPPEARQPFDRWIVTPEAEREDPCAAFAGAAGSDRQSGAENE